MAQEFLNILGGLLSGGVGRYKENSDRDRKTKEREDDLMASSLENRLKSDDTLTPDEQGQIFHQITKLRGMDPKMSQALYQASGYFRNSQAEDTRRNEYAKPGIAPAIHGGGLDIESAPFGAMPAPPQRTAGEIKFQRDLPMETQKASALATAQREAQRAANTGQIDDKVDILKKYNGTDMEDEVRYMLGATPRTSSTSGANGAIFVPGPGTRGVQMKQLLIAQGRGDEAAKLDDTRLYKYTLTGPNRSQIGFVSPTEENTTGSKPTVITPEIFSQHGGKDLDGNPLVVGSMAVPIRNNIGGAVRGYIPETEVNTYATRNNMQVTTDGAGNVVVVPVTESTLTQRYPATGTPAGTRSGGVGLGGGGLGPVPSLPVGSPATSNGVSIPGAPGLPAGAKKIGERPVSIPEGTVDKINASQDLVHQTEALVDQLPRVQGYIGPAAGRLADFSLDHLGGAGLPDEAITFLTNIREMIANKAFERGGKTLPAAEQRIYTAQLPRESDKPRVLMAKLKVFLPLFRKDLENQQRGLNSNQRNQLQNGQGGLLGNPPTPPSTRPSLNDIFKGAK